MHLRTIMRMLTAERLRLQLSHPPIRATCSICRRATWHLRTDVSPRIGIRCLGCRSTAHHRGIYSLIRQHFGDDLFGLKSGTTYEISHHGALFHQLRKDAGRVGFRLISSELAIGAPGETINGVRCENLESLTFSDQEFDLITSTGVMEHVEDDHTAFREILRTLKPNGRYIFTVPFSYGRQETKLRARREPDGSIHHILEPEYHGDPFAGDGGVFTWRNYGSDLLDLLDRIGFRASLKRVALPKLPEPMPVFVAQRA